MTEDKSRHCAWRRIDPYAITMPGGCLHLAGFCHARGKALTFALDGVRGTQSTGHAVRRASRHRGALRRPHRSPGAPPTLAFRHALEGDGLFLR